MRLEVDLEGRGAAEKSGVLWVDDFRVLGDPIVSEVYSSAEVSGPAIDSTPSGQRRVQREVFDFERMKVPFSVGHGQFVLEDSYVRGQALGASIRGKVDYTSQRINLGGTYVPLQGLNSALCNIPLVGPIVSGLDCQGVFGITYAIQGQMSRPQVIVNPLSMLTPGILRGIMEMTNPNPEVLPRAERPKTPVEQRVRASSSDISGGDTPQQKGKTKAGGRDRGRLVISDGPCAQARQDERREEKAAGRRSQVAGAAGAIALQAKGLAKSPLGFRPRPRDLLES